ncbi:Flp pilus assembly protein TadG|uniref:Flp pilus assembly protein TadG n=1 Tax=Brenneria salicis ATCC 15712 = DSM 30166 TaxID=714314 RepID=A0A366I6U7_9GAMM|nr:TadE/TadG family type IV pilus assembly protein [Brenneria salicis]NMN92763.1 Flp pilus assembly protein TadG [Brenneria salicis ATCC 15712 = DSM 30166]RBP63740.1 Flp pilus assembly protein TadG [Brenneria salicis ATCC 15712 = DSM 30166]RLM31025.1 hypothetical protein BHG07_07425 [Brenneria salicis ATCC 15712 = DSM 30166]
MKKHLRTLCLRLKKNRLWHARRGAVAIEAALIIPLAVFIVIASMELYHYFRTASVVDRAAFTIANSLSMQRELNDNQQCRLANDICTYHTIAQDLMTPLDYRRYGGMVISLYATDTDSSGTAVWRTTPEWQRVYQGEQNSHSVAATLRPPDNFPQPSANDSAIVVEVFYRYTPFMLTSAFWQELGGEQQLSARAFYRPRFNDLPIK